MAGAIVNKLLEVFGLPENEENEENEEYLEEEMEEVEEQEERGFFNINRKKVVNMPQTQQVRMVISQPTTFEQAEEICSYLKNRKSVIVNLEYVNKDVARRIVDVVSGAVKALDGNIEKVSNSIFVIAPYNYDIVNEITKEKIESKFSASWIK